MTTRTNDEDQTRATDVTVPTAGRSSTTILVVDDDPDVLELCVDVLRDTGYSVVDALNGADALVLIDSGTMIDVVLTDVVMPGITGPELATAIRRRRPDLPVIFMSGHAATASHQTDQTDAFDIDRILHKPFAHDELADAVRAALT